jgi:hypothetical protein
MGRNPEIGPLLDSLSASLVSRQRTTPGEKAFGAAASLGLSLAILKLVVAYAKTKENGIIGDSSSASTHLTGEHDSVLSWYGIVKKLFRKILDSSSSSTTSEISSDQEEDRMVITHLGSCHCESVEFEVSSIRLL